MASALFPGNGGVSSALGARWRPTLTGSQLAQYNGPRKLDHCISDMRGAVRKQRDDADPAAPAQGCIAGESGARGDPWGTDRACDCGRLGGPPRPDPAGEACGPGRVPGPCCSPAWAKHNEEEACKAAVSQQSGQLTVALDWWKTTVGLVRCAEASAACTRASPRQPAAARCLAGLGALQPRERATRSAHRTWTAHAVAGGARHGAALGGASSHARLAAQPGLCGQSPAGAPADAAEGPRGQRHAAASAPTPRGTDEVSVSRAGGDHRARASGVERRDHLSPLAPGLERLGSGARRVASVWAVVGGLAHLRARLVPGSTGNRPQARTSSKLPH